MNSTNSMPSKSESKIGLDVELFLAGLEGAGFGEMAGEGNSARKDENGNRGDAHAKERNGELMAVLKDGKKQGIKTQLV